MSDDQERQLQAFGATLESSTGEPIRASDHGGAHPDRSRNRVWAVAGAAACVLAVVVGLVVVTGRDAEAPTAQPPAPAPTSTTIPMLVIDPDVVRSAPIAELVTGCDPQDVAVSADYVVTGASVDDAFSVAHAAIVEHTPPGEEFLPTEGWREIAGEPVTVRYLDRGSGIEGIVRIERDGDGWRVAELAQCVRRRVPASVQTTTIPTTIPTVPAEAVPDDPLALERDGWTLVQRTTEPFSAGEIPCEAGQGLADFDGVPSVHDILTPPAGTGLDVDLQVLDVGTPERGNELAAAVLAISDCITDVEGADVEAGSMSSIRASWFRAGPDFALVTIVGERSRSIVLEIENAPFDDDLIGELAHRADQFLKGGPVSTEFASGDDTAGLDRPEIPRRQMTAVEAERFADDETRGLVCDERGFGGTTWDYGPIGPDDVEGRMPVDEFWGAIDDNVRDMEREGGVPYPTDGWTELVRDERSSLFVLEVDGEPKATISVGGDPESGVWRRGQATACQSLFIP